MSTDEDEQIVILHMAKCIIDNHCFIYKPDVIKHLKVNNIVRISFTVDTDINVWSHDSPYVKIVSITGNDILGVIMDINRQITNKYPLSIGDKIWFKKENIIEIPIEYNINKEQYQKFEDNKFRHMLTKNKVLTTGPLYTIEEDESESGSDYSSPSGSDSD